MNINKLTIKPSALLEPGPSGLIRITGDNLEIESGDGKIIISGTVSNIELKDNVNIGNMKK